MTQSLSQQAKTAIGQSLYELTEALYPICRSITGSGVRKSLSILQKYIPLEIHEVPTGTAVLDWTIPKEWNITDAWVKDPKGRKIIDFKQHNLHVLNYSIPIHQKISLDDLKPHLFSLPKHPDWIPYRTSYYQENWGFCLSHRQLENLPDGEYEVCIDSRLTAGHLTYGEYYLPGETTEEVLLTAHICHPSLANDNCAGLSIITHLAQQLASAPRRYSYRFLFIPGTIGAITWLARNKDKVSKIEHGLVASLLGDPGDFTYKKSRQGDAEIDRVVAQVLKTSGRPHQIIDFFPYGYDERQFCSPGFNLAVGNLTRSQFGQYPEYHSSADDLQLVQPLYLEESFDIYQKVIGLLEHNFTYINLQPYGEPQLGKRGLYEAIGGDSDRKQMQMAMLWILNLSDGSNSLLDIAERSAYEFELIAKVSQLLETKQLIKRH
ncbi:MAG: DUF4910 domain-containing protein [Bacteroidota bacterium]